MKREWKRPRQRQWIASIVTTSWMLFFVALANSAEQPNWKQDWTRVIEAAKQEGQLSLYGGQEITHPDIIAGFNKDFPFIKVSSASGRAADIMMNLFHNSDYIFNSDYSFLDRFDPRTEGYFSGQGELTGRFFLTTNFVPDTHTLKLTDYSERGKGSTNMKFNLAKNTMGAHISEFPVGTYKKGHRHASRAYGKRAQDGREAWARPGRRESRRSNFLASPLAGGGRFCEG